MKYLFTHYISRFYYFLNLILYSILSALMFYLPNQTKYPQLQFLNKYGIILYFIGAIISLIAFYTMYRIIYPKLIISATKDYLILKQNIGSVKLNWEDIQSINYDDLKLYTKEGGVKQYKRLFVTTVDKVYKVNVKHSGSKIKDIFNDIGEVAPNIQLSFSHR